MSLVGDRYILILQTQDKSITSPDLFVGVMALYCLMTCFDALFEKNRGLETKDALRTRVNGSNSSIRDKGHAVGPASL